MCPLRSVDITLAFTSNSAARVLAEGAACPCLPVGRVPYQISRQIQVPDKTLHNVYSTVPASPFVPCDRYLPCTRIMCAYSPASPYKKTINLSHNFFHACSERRTKFQHTFGKWPARWRCVRFAVDDAQQGRCIQIQR